MVTPPLASCLAIEIGGTKQQVITGTGDGCILQRHRFAVPSEAGAKVIQQGIEAGVRELLRSFQPERIGVGFGGPLDRATARVARSHQVEGWSGFDLNAWLSELARCPVVADNDTNMAALGEARLGLSHLQTTLETATKQHLSALILAFGDAQESFYQILPE